MHHFYRILLLLFFSISLFAQNPIPNFGFESWTGGEPDNWTTNNIALSAIPVTQSSDNHSGSLALKGEVVNFLGNPYLPTVTSGGTLGPYFTVTQNYEKLTGYYKLNSLNNDNFSVALYLYDSNFGIVAMGSAIIEVATSSYLPFEAFFDYSNGNGNNAAYCRIDLFIGNSVSGSVTIGSYFLADELVLAGTASGMERNIENGIPQSFNLDQNFPNPFNPTTNFRFSIPKSAEVSLVIYNQLGQEVDRIINEYLQAGIYDVDWDAQNLPSGQYFYRITAGEFSETKKLLLMK